MMPEQTRFLNVDLDLWANFDLEPLVTAFGKKVYALHVGRVKRTFEAHLELERRTTDADSTIRAFCKLIAGLPPEARAMWDAVKIRDFNIGVQAETTPHCEVFVISAPTVKSVADLGARIVFTVYSVPAAPVPEARPAAPDPSV
ncbi:MAG: hypothetical protein JNK87_27645 [Bryobacterales bacterium]|nr:hypothetical protein [Bryobacterales bacterium]